MPTFLSACSRFQPLPDLHQPHRQPEIAVITAAEDGRIRAQCPALRGSFLPSSAIGTARNAGFQPAMPTFLSACSRFQPLPDLHQPHRQPEIAVITAAEDGRIRAQCPALRGSFLPSSAIGTARNAGFSACHADILVGMLALSAVTGSPPTAPPTRDRGYHPECATSGSRQATPQWPVFRPPPPVAKTLLRTPPASTPRAATPRHPLKPPRGADRQPVVPPDRRPKHTNADRPPVLANARLPASPSSGNPLPADTRSRRAERQQPKNPTLPAPAALPQAGAG